jgi:arylsulfatase A-like enzyme
MYNPEEIKPWGSFEEQFIGKPYIQRQQIHTWGVQDWRWADWAPIVARYYGEISLLDHEIGRVVEHLEKLGLLENTIIIYTSDHGDLCGSHRMMDKHYVMYDDVVRVPLIAYWSGKIKPGIRQEFVSHAIDLASTICELAGCDIPDSFQGQSLVPLLLGKSYRAREDIYCAYHGAQFGLYSQRMVRDRKWKYVWNLTAEDELYDVETDPWELDNKAGQVEFQDILQSERRRMVAWLEKTKDPLYHTWTDFQLTHSRKI